ncbi:TetR/AcrR family transcriptional regulator [Nocardioides zeae]|uniref:AcrR family transcriptional regulator n=1 Tax=Nocardioides zeae TaxID=1457234 RepID=A0AAJ1U9V1_9ACTN|nr:TetR/AcrR family transcriptional regulator [Nocardioides zeae]MDQ1106772.1 AcrR family transcriptional regulator [Nocardioides zeae]
MTTAEKPSRAAQRAASARRILDAAREEFAAHGYDKATIRAIASRAGVDPALVMQHHGSKAALFRSAVQLTGRTVDDVDAHLREVVDARLDGLPPELHALVRSMLTVPEASESMRAYLDERVVNLAGALQGPDAEARAALAVCALLGLTIGKHFLHLDVFDRIPEADVARVAGARLSGPGG